ncbi:MAG: pseudouridine synthase [Deltaproteobacteria bacterium]|nr:pseudouridine synthase [Deltaproteobacteria bacterium]
MERLQKIIARAGLASRREAETWILEGRVTLNGRVVRKLGTTADPDKDKLKVDGRIVLLPQKHHYYAFHKPLRMVTSMGDPKGRANVGDWLKTLGREQPVYPVGRLDYNSSGLLLLTNHGELAFRLSHPRYEVKKVYEVKINGIPNDRDLKKLRGGISLSDGLTSPARVRILKPLKNKCWLEIEIHEGRYREVRRMFEALGYTVEKLVRTRFGPVRLGSLPVGECHPLTVQQVESLRKAVGLSSKDGSRS